MKILPNNVEKIINEFNNKVQILLGNHMKQSILYGSYARGDFNKNSDIDIMILTDLDNKELENFADKIVEIAYDIEEKNKFEIHISPLIKNINEFNYWLDTIPFYMNIEKEGVCLNG